MFALLDLWFTVNHESVYIVFLVFQVIYLYFALIDIRELALHSSDKPHLVQLYPSMLIGKFWLSRCVFDCVCRTR